MFSWRLLVVLPSDPKVVVADIDSAPIETATPRGVPTEHAYQTLWERFTQISDEKIQLQLEVEQLRGAKTTADILDRLIEPYALRTFVFMCSYCAFVGLIIILDMIFLRLPVPVLQVLVGSTAITVIGLVGMVLTGVFVGARPKR